MHSIFTRRKMAPLATVMMALFLVGCVDEGRYYHGNDGPRDFRRDGGRIAPYPPRYDYDRHYRRDRYDPPRRDYGRNPPPSIYDDRGRGDDGRRYDDDRRDRRPKPPIYPHDERPHYERGNVSIYEYSR